MKSVQYLILLLLVITINSTNGYKILMVCPLPATSHNNLCRGIVDTLVERGHEVTFISGRPVDKPKYRVLYVDAAVNAIFANMPPLFSMVDMAPHHSIAFLTKFNEAIAKHVFEDDGVKKLITDESEKFDLVIYEHFMSKFFIGFGIKYGCPTIALSPTAPMLELNGMMNNPLALATSPNLFTAYTTEMSLYERIHNTGITFLQSFLIWYITEPSQKALYQQYFPKESKMVPYEELSRHLSLIFSNTHPSFSYAKPLFPNTVEIGGYHIKHPEPLPDDLKKILDDSKNGVVYFSMGSNLKSSEMTPEMKRSFLETFKQLKQTIVWKYEEDLPEKSDNVIIRKWMPQTGILAHPNVKLFISHGGLLSCTEAVHFGVPLLAIPVFGDQKHNAQTAELIGYGSVLQFKNVTDVSFKWAMKEMLENDKYSKKVKEIYRLYHDRPLRPQDSLIYHAEHVIRTKGGKHLSPPSLSRCSHLLLDVFAIVFIPLAIILHLFVFIVVKCCCKKSNIVKLDNKQKKQ